jgi:hypothetical protein
MSRGWINPIHLGIPLLLLIISLPLAIFAVATTVLALLTLCIRVVVVYSDLCIVLLRQLLFRRSKDLVSAPPTPRQYVQQADGKRKVPLSRAPSVRSRKSSTSQSESPVFENKTRAARSDSYASLLGIGVPNRDYEGVGGWRLVKDVDADETDSDDERWLNMNSRLELPLGTPIPVTGSLSSATVNSNGKRHNRSLTGSSGRVNFNGESMRMSPVASRTPAIRTPVAGSKQQEDEDAGYFVANPGEKSNMSRRRSMGTMTNSNGHNTYAELLNSGRRSKKGSVENFGNEIQNQMQYIGR